MRYKIYIPKQGSDGKPFDFDNLMFHLGYLSEGFTIYDGLGYWKGNLEKVWVFEIVTTNPIETRLQLALENLKTQLKQEAMFYTKTEMEGVLI